MNEFNRAPHENKVISLVERRNKEIDKSLQWLLYEVAITKGGIQKELDEIKLLANLEVLEDPNIGENVVDLEIYRSNKILLEKNAGWAAGKGEVKESIYILVKKIRDAMDNLYNVQFKKAMEYSHGLSETELNVEYDYAKSGEELFSDQDLADKPVVISLKIFIPRFVKYLENVQANIEDLSERFKQSNINPDETTDELCQLRNQIQSGLHYVEYYQFLFEKNNPSK